MKKISIVIPCFNEQDNVEPAYVQIKDVFEKLPEYSWEMIFMDNDSTDLTRERLRALCEKDKRVKAIFNTRNFGPDCNTINGFFAATGDCVVWICCDLQEPPEMIIDMVRKWEQGEKLVWGQKTETQESFVMATCRKIYYWLISKFAETKQYQHCTAWGLYDRMIVEELRKLNDPNPVLRNIIPNLGYKPCLLLYRQRNRERGKSSYNFFRYFDYALNSVVHTTKVPMKVMIYFGAICGTISFLIGCFYLFRKLLFWNEFTLGLAPVIVSVTFISSVQIFFLGIMGEYILAILDRVGFTKHVVEKERINFDEEDK